MGADDQTVDAGITGAAAVPRTMRAVVLDAPGPPSALAARELPVPVPPAGWVLIRVRAFGLNRATLGAVPEMLQTSYGSLTTGLDARPGQSVLIRGGTSSVGLATALWPGSAR